MKMKQVLATGAALSMALSMAPVTASAADKVDINVIAAQYGQQTADWWANFVTEFNEANPDINLNVEVVSWNDIYTVVNTRIANGEAPDVLNIDVFADYQADDLLLPIQDVVSEETYSKMYDAFLAQSEVDGTVWAIPDLASARAMYYNKDILDAAGVEVPHEDIGPFPGEHVAQHAAAHAGNEANENGRKHIKYDEIDKSYLIGRKGGVLVHYLEQLQKDLASRG